MLGLVSAGLMCSVKPDGVPQLCKADEIGELCVCTVATGSSYYGLTGMTKNTFEVRAPISFFGILMTYFILELNNRCTWQVFPISSSGTPISEFSFTRTGLLGFIGPAGLIFVAGKIDGLMVVGGRRHNADDIVATALAVEPMKFVYRGRYVLSLVIFMHHQFVVCTSSFGTTLMPRTRRPLSFS